MIILLTIIVILLGFLVFPDLMLALVRLAMGLTVVGVMILGAFLFFAAITA